MATALRWAITRRPQIQSAVLVGSVRAVALSDRKRCSNARTVVKLGMAIISTVLYSVLCGRGGGPPCRRAGRAAAPAVVTPAVTHRVAPEGGPHGDGAVRRRALRGAQRARGRDSAGPCRGGGGGHHPRRATGRDGGRAARP